MSFERLLAFWPIPVFYMTFTLISWLLCQSFVPLLGINKYYKRFVLACVMFNNANSLPVAIISSLAVSEAGKTLYWGPDDTQRMVSARYVVKCSYYAKLTLLFFYSGISYCLFFGLFCNILRWSYGYNLLQKKEDDDNNDTMTNDEEEQLCASYAGSINADYGSLSSSNESSRRSSEATVSEEQTNKHESTLPEEHSRVIQFFKTLDSYMSPPLYAALLALFVGLVPPVKHALYDPDSFLYASLTRGIEGCGKASVPIVLICLGAQLKSIRQTQQHQSTSKYRRPVSVALFLRMVLTPICVIPLVYAFTKWGQSWSSLTDDPMFLVSMVVVGCTPTAINLAQITQVSGIFEEEMLNMLFWSYGVICIPVCTLVVFLALTLVN
jgi:predicted permease